MSFKAPPQAKGSFRTKRPEAHPGIQEERAKARPLILVVCRLSDEGRAGQSDLAHIVHRFVAEVGPLQVAQQALRGLCR